MMSTLPPETAAEAKSGGGVVLQRLVRPRCPACGAARVGSEDEADTVKGWIFVCLECDWSWCPSDTEPRPNDKAYPTGGSRR